jgi:ComF family protein
MSASLLRRGLGRIIDTLLNPGYCLACGAGLGGGESLCAVCKEHLQRVPNPCRYCGEPNPVGSALCPACLRNPPRWQGLSAPFQYRGLAREYLLRLKYSESLHLARVLCRAGGVPVRDHLPWPEVLLPVPLHRERMLERGYNQAAEIATAWSGMLDIPVDRRALRRLRATASQSGLNAAERTRNLRGAFEYRTRKTYRHVAVIDDIVTTGSTADEITRVLHRSCVDCVEIWALARAYRR